MPRITLGTLLRILVASLVVGMVMAFFGVQPTDILAWLAESVREAGANAEAWIGWTATYVLLGAVERTDVQNIDLMNLAGFCRNCLAKWYRAAAEERGEAMTYDQARELIYGMPYEDWRSRYQTEASAEATTKFARDHG